MRRSVGVVRNSQLVVVYGDVAVMNAASLVKQVIAHPALGFIEDLDESVRGDITVRHVLTHTTGFRTGASMDNLSRHDAHQANDRIAKMHPPMPTNRSGRRGDVLRYPYDHPYAARELGRRARANVADSHEATAALVWATVCCPRAGGD